MSADPLASVGSIQQLAANLSNLGPQLSDAARTGNFAAVLSQVNSEMEGVATGAPAATTSPQAALPAAGWAGADPSGSAGASLTATGLLPGGSSSVVPAAALFSPQATATAAPETGAGSGPTGAAVVADAKRYLGVPYQWGGTDPASGLDCSGLVQRVYSDLGVSLPRTSEEQATAGTEVPGVAQARPGDLVFYDPSATGPGHVGIYIGDGLMINAPHTGTVVRVDSVGTPSQIRRILPDAPAAAATTTAFTGPASTAMSALGAPAALQPMFAAAGQRYGVDPALLAAVARQESGFQPGAVSGAGAEGLMQLMPATAAGLGVSPLDPASAIDGAAQLLSGYLRDYGGSVPMALAAYNAGPGAVAQYGGVPPYGETRNYVASITSMLAAAEPAGVVA